MFYSSPWRCSFFGFWFLLRNKHFILVLSFVFQTIFSKFYSHVLNKFKLKWWLNWGEEDDSNNTRLEPWGYHLDVKIFYKFWRCWRLKMTYVSFFNQSDDAAFSFQIFSEPESFLWHVDSSLSCLASSYPFDQPRKLMRLNQTNLVISEVFVFILFLKLITCDIHNKFHIALTCWPLDLITFH